MGNGTENSFAVADQRGPGFLLRLQNGGKGGIVHVPTFLTRVVFIFGTLQESMKYAPKRPSEGIKKGVQQQRRTQPWALFFWRDQGIQFCSTDYHFIHWHWLWQCLFSHILYLYTGIECMTIILNYFSRRPCWWHLMCTHVWESTVGGILGFVSEAVK